MKTSAYLGGRASPFFSTGALIGGIVSDKVSVVCLVSSSPEDGRVVDDPFPELVTAGTVFENASKNTGVPKVSVRAIART